METNETQIIKEKKLKLVNAIGKKMLSDIAAHSIIISTEDLKLLVCDFKSNPEELFNWDVRITLKIFELEIERRSHI